MRLSIPTPTCDVPPYLAWDLDKLATEARHGFYRQEFIHNVSSDLEAATPLFDVFVRDNTPTRHEALFVQIVRRNGLKLFSKAAVPPWYKVADTTRDDLLQEQRDLRTAGSGLNPENGKLLRSVTAKIKNTGGQNGNI